MIVHEDGSIESNGLTLRAVPRVDMTLRHACERHAADIGLKHKDTIVIERDDKASNQSVTVTIDGMSVTTFSALQSGDEIESVARTTVERIKQRRAELPAVRIPAMNPVRSQSIAEVGHDGAALFVRFKHGALYRYPGVPVEKYATLRRAESVGHYLQTEILRHYDGFVVRDQE